MKFILGTKQHMTQVFDDAGRAYAGTILRVEPMKVTQVKSVEKDGYLAAQLAGGAQKEQRVSKPVLGHMKGAYKYAREFRPRTAVEKETAIPDLEVGGVFDVSVFTPGDMVAVSAISKGKGFQGVVKRHGFHGGRASHGQKHSLREPGSIGGGGRAGGRVAKDTKMAGRMGSDRVTVKNLRVLQVNADAQILVLSGAVPGRRGTVVEVRAV